MDESAAPAPPGPIESVSAPPPPEQASVVMTTERLCAAFASLQSELESLHAVTSQHDHRATELDARDGALREYAAQLTDREFHLAERHRELNSAQEQLLADAGTWRQREAEMLARERSVGERESAPPIAPARHQACDEPHVATRRARLKKQRSLLSERAAQLVRAKEAITSRLADTGRTRHSLPLAGQPVRPSPMPATAAPIHRPMTATFGAGMLAASLSFAAIAGVSWWVAGIVDRPRYLAQTTIGMADQSANVEPELAESWSSFHLELANDPQLLAQAAERLKRRGYAEFGTPSDVRRLIVDSMTIDAATPGRLNLSMVGEGRLRTQRILETYTSILVGMANDSRERRADQSSTAVVADATAGEEPASDHRLPIFALVAGAMACVCTVVGLAGVGIAVGRRERGAKDETAVEIDGGEDRWSIK